MKTVDNEVYDRLGARWYEAQDDPVALLRAEARVRNPWIAETIKRSHLRNERWCLPWPMKNARAGGDRQDPPEAWGISGDYRRESLRDPAETSRMSVKQSCEPNDPATATGAMPLA